MCDERKDSCANGQLKTLGKISIKNTELHLTTYCGPKQEEVETQEGEAPEGRDEVRGDRTVGHVSGAHLEFGQSK